MFFWKSKWKKEIDSVLPELSCVDSERSVAVSKLPNKRRTFKYFLATAMATVLVLTCILSTTLFVPPVSEKKVVVVEINPSVAFVIDENDVVTHVKPLNQDADVILAEGKDTYVGKDVSTAMQNYLDDVLELGYLDFEGDSVKVIADSWDTRIDKIKEDMQSFLFDKGASSIIIPNKIEREDFYSLLGVGNAEKGIVDSVSDLPDKYIRHDLSGLTSDEIKQKYKDYLIEEYSETIKEYLLKIGGLEEFLDFTDFETVLEYVKEIELFEQSLKFLDDLPENEQDFTEKIEQSVQSIINIKKEINKENYNKERDKLVGKDQKNPHNPKK